MNTICNYDSYECDVDECQPVHETCNETCHEALHHHPDKMCKWIELKAKQEQKELNTEDMVVLAQFVENETKFINKYVNNGRIMDLSMAGPIIKFGNDSYSYVLIGRYDFAHVWEWAWNMDETADHSALREIYSKLPVKLQTPKIHHCGSHLIIKLLLSYIFEYGKFTYIVTLPYMNETMLVLGCYFQ